MIITSEKMAELRGLLEKANTSISLDDNFEMIRVLRVAAPDLLDAIDRLRIERDNQYDENIDQIARYAAIEAERDKYRAMAVRLAKSIRRYLRNDSLRTTSDDEDAKSLLAGPDIALLLMEEDHG